LAINIKFGTLEFKKKPKKTQTLILMEALNNFVIGKYCK